MPTTLLTALLLLSLGSVPGIDAQPAPQDSGFQFRLFGDIVVDPSAREGLVVVVKGNAVIDGRVRAVLVVDGDAILTGTVEDLTVIHGQAQLKPGAIVTDVHLIDSEIAIAEGAKVTGTIERGAGRRIARDVAGFAALIGLGVLIALVLGGVLAAEVAPDGVRSAGDLMRTDLGKVAVGALVVWVAMPFAAVMLVPTLIGLPMGVGFFLFVLPVLWYLGLIVAGTWVGDQVLGRLRGRVEATRPWLAATIGIAGLLLIGRVPVVGALVFVVVALGSGGVVLTAWRLVRTPALAAQTDF